MFIELTRYQKTGKVWVNYKQIKVIEPHRGTSTKLLFSGEELSLFVEESAQQVLQLINEEQAKL